MVALDNPSMPSYLQRDETEISIKSDWLIGFYKNADGMGPVDCTCFFAGRPAWAPKKKKETSDLHWAKDC